MEELDVILLHVEVVPAQVDGRVVSDGGCPEDIIIVREEGEEDAEEEACRYTQSQTWPLRVVESPYVRPMIRKVAKGETALFPDMMERGCRGLSQLHGRWYECCVAHQG